MKTYAEIVIEYGTCDLDGDSLTEITNLCHLHVRDARFDPPLDPVQQDMKLVLVIVEDRLLDELPGSRYTVRDLFRRLLKFRSDLSRDGFQAKFLAMTANNGPIHQDGKSLLAMREFFKAVRDSYSNFAGVILVGSFPQASLVRTWPQYEPQDGQYRVGLTPAALNPYEIVLADLDGNWRELYHESITLDRYYFQITPATTVTQTGTKVILVDPTITHETATLQDVFWLKDAEYRIIQPLGGKATVELDMKCLDPEVSGEDKERLNPVARPKICVSRIDARPVAVQPPAGLLDPAGKPREVPYDPATDPNTFERWSRDPNLERTLLIEYFDRNHAFRRGDYASFDFEVSLVEAGLGTFAANEGLDGLNTPRSETPGVTLLEFIRWLKRPAPFRAIAAHASDMSTQLADDPNAATNTPLAEMECGGGPWRWILENGKLVPSFKGLNVADLGLYRTLWENRTLGNLPPGFLMHVGCDVATFAHGYLPYHHPWYGTYQNAASLLFYGNLLAVLARVTWWNRGPFGFGTGFGRSPGSVVGEGWKEIFEAVSNNAGLAGQTTERKQSYVWSLIGDWTLRKYYTFQGIIVDEERPEYLAVDPVSLVLSPAAYIRLTLPDPPPMERLVKVVRKQAGELSPEGVETARSRIRTLKAYVNALEKGLSQPARKSPPRKPAKSSKAKKAS